MFEMPPKYQISSNTPSFILHFRFKGLRKANSGIYRCTVDLSLMGTQKLLEPQFIEKDYALMVVGDDDDDYILV